MCNWFHLMLTCRSKSFLKRLQTTSVHDVTFRSTQVYTAVLYGCWAHKVWTGLAFRDLEVSLAKLQCRHHTRRRPNSGSFLTRWTHHSPTDDTDPVTFSIRDFFLDNSLNHSRIKVNFTTWHLTFYILALSFVKNFPTRKKLRFLY